MAIAHHRRADLDLRYQPGVRPFAYVQAWVAATGIEPAGTAESVAARFLGWLGETSQPWLVVLDDLSETADLDGLWPEGAAGRVLVTTTQSAVASRRRGTQVIPVGFFSVREALSCLTERLSANPVQRHGAIDLVETLGREPLALAQASSVIASSTLDCLDYRDVFVREKVFGRDHPDTLATIADLAGAYQAAGRMPAAMRLAEQCCAESERVLGADHADTLARLANLAHLYYAVGRVGDATALLRDTAARCERVLPDGDPLTQAVRQSLANIGEG